jgi:hypothetical protein
MKSINADKGDTLDDNPSRVSPFAKTQKKQGINTKAHSNKLE